jgi:hypothetical protein
MLFDPVKDDGFNNSREYYHFSHWIGFACEMVPGTAGTKIYTMIGHVAPRVRTKRPPGETTSPSPSPFPVEKNPGQTTGPSPFQVGPKHQKKIDIYTK